MGHAITVLAGPIRLLSAIRAAAGPRARIFSLTPGADVLVLPLSDAVHDALHRINGTGEWSDTGVRLTSTDITFFARASLGSCLAYLETDFSEGGGSQAAALWENGVLKLGPVRLDMAQAERRPPQLWPINAALRGLGVTARMGADEFQTFGLARFASNEALAAGGFEVAPSR